VVRIEAPAASPSGEARDARQRRGGTSTTSPAICRATLCGGMPRAMEDTPVKSPYRRKLYHADLYVPRVLWAAAKVEAQRQHRTWSGLIAVLLERELGWDEDEE